MKNENQLQTLKNDPKTISQEMPYYEQFLYYNILRDIQGHKPFKQSIFETGEISLKKLDFIKELLKDKKFNENIEYLNESWEPISPNGNLGNNTRKYARELNLNLSLISYMYLYTHNYKVPGPKDLISLLNELFAKNQSTSFKRIYPDFISRIKPENKLMDYVNCYLYYLNFRYYSLSSIKFLISGNINDLENIPMNATKTHIMGLWGSCKYYYSEVQVPLEIPIKYNRKNIYINSLIVGALEKLLYQVHWHHTKHLKIENKKFNPLCIIDYKNNFLEISVQNSGGIASNFLRDFCDLEKVFNYESYYKKVKKLVMSQKKYIREEKYLRNLLEDSYFDTVHYFRYTSNIIDIVNKKHGGYSEITSTEKGKRTYSYSQKYNRTKRAPQQDVGTTSTLYIPAVEKKGIIVPKLTSDLI